MIRKAVNLALVFAFNFVSIKYTVACTCVMTPIEAHIKTTKNIVIVKVVELLDTEKEREEYYFSKPDRSYQVRVQIDKIYKGRYKKGQIIQLSSEFSNCDIYFKHNEKYLLFLYKKNNKYFVRPCSYSKHVDNGKENIETIENVLHKKQTRTAK